MGKPRAISKKNEEYASNVNKRGHVPETKKAKAGGYTVGPILLGFFLFVVVGSSIVQIIRTATSGSPF
eukprot:EC714598.1.p3 GENE.EC714598.1~~EC714598.1.p3  ORF type:complete len:68 (+),score=3.20 EC714598.1:83-286(+)